MKNQNQTVINSNIISHNIKLETLNTFLIKPSKPTPPNLKIFKLSLLDQLSPNIHGNSTFFFPNKYSSHSHSSFSHYSKLLQTSLSQTLSLFYPFAGRLQHSTDTRTGTTIHCNDDGVLFIESQTTTTLSQLLTNPDFNTLECFLPVPTTENQNMLLLVRFTLFSCGSTALTISLTHKISDFNTFMTFLNTWTAVCAATPVPLPDLTTASTLFPPRELPEMSASFTPSSKKFTSRRFIFHACKIEELKREIKREIEFFPSRVEVVLALIWRCALSASRSKTRTFKRSVLFQAVNLRPRMDPAVPETAVGNFVWSFVVTVEEECHMALHETVKRMRNGMKEFIENEAKTFKEEGGFKVVMESFKDRVETLIGSENEESVAIYKCSSWCKFPVLEFDFGWGKPVWNCCVNKLVSNTIALMDTKDGDGVEAFVTLDEDDMELFKQDEELLHYAVLNPRIII
ncbi:unnamed protein product [Vicia faba]|uniref:Uncharacterized protein n=1 Tax=Vicia faba TaxID=3906 RepID=A0AAV0Z1Q7_VICFA|nr:unnamed protein product [Vicia faba]